MNEMIGVKLSENLRGIKAPSDGHHLHLTFLGGSNISGFIADINHFIGTEFILSDQAIDNFVFAE